MGHKSYGSIPHLPGSRRGPGDHGLSEQHASICTTKTRDKHDLIIVQEKLDGSNVAVANIDGAIVPLIRAGYRAETSKYEQHRAFAAWVHEQWSLFDFLKPGDRLVGEWLMQAHGTRYKLKHGPFVVFDLMYEKHRRLLYSEFVDRLQNRIPVPHLVHQGGAISTKKAMDILGENGYHGALDPAEGCVWRVERKGVVDFLAKFVRPGKVDGYYLPEISGKESIWNWKKEGAT